MVITLEKAKHYILSKEYLDYVIQTGRWCEHGSSIFNYFDCEDLIIEYSNSKERRQIMKSYIKERLEDILFNLENESPQKLYRVIYADCKPSKKGFFGHYWSSREDTNACVEIEQTKKEYLLTAFFDHCEVDWIETLKSRLDFAYGEREQEYYLKKFDVILDDVILI